MTSNNEIAKIFNQIADILEISSESLFRIRAYRNAARSIEALTEDVAQIIERGELENIPAVGKDLAGKISDFVKTGKIEFFERLKKQTPAALLELIKIPGIGPKTAKLLVEKAKIKDIGDLEKKLKAHKLSALPGVGEKTQENILKGIQLLKRARERLPLGIALPLAEEITGRLGKLPQTDQIAICGSLRRQKETIRDIDILMTSSDPRKVMDAFAGLPSIKEILARGPTKSSAILKEGIQVDVRVVEPKNLGAALLYFTGSKEHNIRLRELAVKKGLKINEYGIFNAKTNKILGGRTEEEMYKTLGLGFVPPELREDRGEIEAARDDRLPRLIEIKDIKGDFHVHTTASDGLSSLEELARSAIDKGYKYIAVTDHSKSLKVAGGLSERELLDQIREIKRLNKKFKDFRILAGSEVDILDDGSLDFKDEILSQLDVVIAAIHTGFKQPGEKLTRRIIKAMQNRHVNIIAHLTGRLLGAREAYAVDVEEVFRAAKETNTALEISAFPQRLDLDDINARRAKELGLMLAIGTDSHEVAHLGNMRYGLGVARRGWLEAKDALNTLSAEKVLQRLKKD